MTIFLTAFSGIIGALIGVSAGFLIARWTKYIDTRTKLRLFLLANGHDIRNGIDGKPFHEIFGRNHVEIQAAYFDLRALTFLQRKRLDRAWYDYNGIRDYDKIPDDEPYKLFGRAPANNREEAIARIHDFFNALS
jgi:hypothetical protein